LILKFTVLDQYAKNLMWVDQQFCWWHDELSGFLQI